MMVTEFEDTAGILVRFQGLVKHFHDTIQPKNTDQDNPNIPAMGFSIYDVVAIFEQVGCKRMPERVAAGWFNNRREEGSFLA